MELPKEQRERLLIERGITVTTCCDRCGQVLGAVTFVKRGEPGVFCSRECRRDSSGEKERGQK